MKTILEVQDHALKTLAGAMGGFYLVGGTALSREYFHHRESYDLDFFTKSYSFEEINRVMDLLRGGLKKKFKKIIDSDGKSGFVKMCRYQTPLGKGEPFKIDFVEDPVDLLKPFKRMGGIDYASLDDIYLRKIYAVTGFIAGKDVLGRIQTKGKRQEARDLFDLYHLSKTYKRLVVFIREYPGRFQVPAILQWYHSLNKIDMNFGLSDIITSNPLEFTEISRYFKKEIDELMKEIV